ncbi:hypothetical protein P5G51_015470 [Virgibacillus sp. 179-BFC.A HS]|uniref:Uncharacterized protein n=1 Tax=Tigheibacillus jepli TaxID=3035914 RepID=A0ABU5CJT5_9BACI|nr:hypothetical protein [Virgibacillus sp. 179-BFC.A HS]MDY0406576.1 hypothetical protein [Virgibacillus sp. 179-BFC.A HS]
MKFLLRALYSIWLLIFLAVVAALSVTFSAFFVFLAVTIGIYQLLLETIAVFDDCIVLRPARSDKLSLEMPKWYTAKQKF